MLLNIEKNICVYQNYIYFNIKIIENFLHDFRANLFEKLKYKWTLRAINAGIKLLEHMFKFLNVFRKKSPI
jgi:hypothetical protein